VYKEWRYIGLHLCLCALWKCINRSVIFFYSCGASTLLWVVASPYGASRSYSLGTPYLVGLLWASDQTDTETSILQQTTLKRDKLPCPQLNSNPQFQHASGRRPSRAKAWVCYLRTSYSMEQSPSWEANWFCS